LRFLPSGRVSNPTFLSSATLPKLIKEDEEERFYKRKYINEDLESIPGEH